MYDVEPRTIDRLAPDGTITKTIDRSAPAGTRYDENENK